MNSKTIFLNIFRWVVLLFVQIFLLRNLSFYNLSTPFVYVLFILVLPFRIPNLLLFLIAFGTGLTMDAFYDTMGVHTSACVALAFVRILFISVSLNRDAIDDPEPSLGNMGFKWFSIYAVLCIFVHHLVLFFLEAFKLSELAYTFGRSLLSVVFTMFTVLLVEAIFHNRKST
ncbi:rod shape-determining protein MreD [Pedobacter frigiditerrae]|uniref:Rod shape-determining protein MreD n=1 Tax=Pedobacter frigiditerrae TaxID=2530452 RepID=A0A4R0MKY1_9SPHI|nr:rod shape-determining protein MreD [Pedobacter frigiditerrae]TCC87057.1 rod shape-determining protein MreD [Pedobacter frigiditerrae]